MLMKIHRSREMGDVVAVCDRELLNTTIRHDNLVITITDTFYGTAPATENEVRDALRNATNVNIIGERSVAVAIGMGLITKAGCMMVGTVPHAQIYRV